MDAPNPDVCTKCGEVHNPKLCTAHSKKNEGGQCRNLPLTGQKVCRYHGGSASRAKEKALVTQTDEKVRKALGRLDITPIGNPFAELTKLAAEAVAWKEVCANAVAELTTMRYGTDGGEAIRGEILLFERAIDRCVMVLATIAKLRIDERLVAVTEAQARMVLHAIDAALQAAGVTGDATIAAKRAASRHLRSVNSS